MEEEKDKAAPETTGGSESREETGDIAEKVDAVKKATKEKGGRKALIDSFKTVDITLSKPFTWCDKTYTEIHLDFEGLKGRDMEAIDDEIGAYGLRGVVPSYSRLYQRLLSARASGIPADAIENMPLADYNAIVNAAQHFLVITG